MKKLYLSLSLLAAFAYQSNAQTYADDVAQIMFDKCTGCHHTGGGAPFALMTYGQVSAWASTIQNSVNTGSMPPWPPNNAYQEYAHDRSLTAAQIATINDWVNAGAPQGNPANTPAAPVYQIGSQLGTPDISVRIPDYTSKATSSQDDYVCFSIPISGLTTTRTIKAIEVIPGDPSIVHHALIYADPTASYPTDTSSHACGGPSSASIKLLAGYAPGSSPTQFPNSSTLRLGIDVSAGSNLVFAMHYPEGSQGKLDSTQVNIHFYPQGTSGIRQVTASPILVNTSFIINANTTDSVETYFPPTTPLGFNATIYSVFPHLHKLGQSFIVYAVNTAPPFDKIPLIHIPKWDFEWQDFYIFKYLQKVPAGYRLYGKALYDNTTNNPYNPNNPPQNVGWGENTSDEMFLVYFQYMAYQNGDENINVDSLLQLQNPTSTKPIAVNNNGLFLTSYPNPSKDITTIQYYVSEQADVLLDIYDVQGKLVKRLVNNEMQYGEQFITWDGSNDSGNAVPAGVYYSTLKVGNKSTTHKIVRHPK